MDERGEGMKATMTEDVILFVEPESGVEAFALREWAKKVDWNIAFDQAKVNLSVSMRVAEGKTFGG